MINYNHLCNKLESKKKDIMLVNLLKSKLHKVNITNVHLNYEGSCAIDLNLLEAAEILEYGMLHIYNLVNGKRFTTYAIKAERGSEIISLNGAASFMGDIGDEIIICTYANFDYNKLDIYEPKLVYIKEKTNKISHIGTKIDTQQL